MQKDNCQKGTPHHHPTDKTRSQVEGFCLVGFSQQQMADFFGIDIETLVKHYKTELQTTKMKRLDGIAKSAYQRAMEGNDKMTELILRTQARWSNAVPVQEIIHTNKSDLERHAAERAGIKVNEEPDASAE